MAFSFSNLKDRFPALTVDTKIYPIEMRIVTTRHTLVYSFDETTWLSCQDKVLKYLNYKADKMSIIPHSPDCMQPLEWSKMDVVQ